MRNQRRFRARQGHRNAVLAASTACKNLSAGCLIANSFLSRDADFEFARPSSLPSSASFWIAFSPRFVPASIVPSMIPRDGLLDSEQISPHATVSWRSCAFDRRPSADRGACRLVLDEVLVFLGAGSLTPARRALESPMAIICLVDRAPCFPSRT